ncbi:hypothetical protein [Actinomadura litoris]|uniref:Uncharacterized protein n=1 Tax=Actinomadura litoris TaxID=2678616 RepID=A0A7K1L1R2_9ACTN|nr:hypothetical protein [Actinomadura litoris]MUN38205.1 hypothetical protein [Actinomadura litoris]
MGYDLHMTRKDNWSEELGAEISTDEWAEVVAADPDLVMCRTAQAVVDGQELTYEHRWLAQMVTHPERDEKGAWLDWSNGRIDVKNPDDLLVEKMRQIARRLNARVQGDDGEYYDEFSSSGRPGSAERA